MTALLELSGIVLESGEHTSPEEGLCLLEAVAYIAGEKHSDHPACVCPVLAAFGRSWNDALDVETRQRLKDYIPQMIGTAGDGNEDRRAWMCVDWLTRECAPAFFDLTESLKPHAET